MMDGYDMTGQAWVVMLLLWGVLIALIVWANLPGDSRRDRRSEPDARQILDRRLARGDLDAARYDELRERLTP